MAFPKGGTNAGARSERPVWTVYIKITETLGLISPRVPPNLCGCRYAIQPIRDIVPAPYSFPGVCAPMYSDRELDFIANTIEKTVSSYMGIEPTSGYLIRIAIVCYT